MLMHLRPPMLLLDWMEHLCEEVDARRMAADTETSVSGLLYLETALTSLSLRLYDDEELTEIDKDFLRQVACQLALWEPDYLQGQGSWYVLAADDLLSLSNLF